MSSREVEVGELKNGRKQMNGDQVRSKGVEVGELKMVENK
jgi:hypothetical protein